MDRLCQYAWPGNVRELENVIERAVALETTPAILVERLPESLLMHHAPAGGVPEIQLGFNLDEYLRDLERQFLMRALHQSDGDRGQAARLLGVSPRSLRYLVAKHRAGEVEDDA
jgi:two-component system response regulator PilR (NtrC family)